jgi:pimeloyl-ACP methyl ester carboxylesterase
MGAKAKLSGAVRPAMQGSGTEHAIVFVHGLSGGPAKTWSPLLQLLGADHTFDRVTLDCYAYPTRLLSIPFLAPPPGLNELVEGLHTFLHDRYGHYERIDLVAHSLGGVVVRTFLVAELRNGSPLPIRKVGLIAVPNAGSSLASIASKVSVRHQQLKALCKNSEAVRATDDAWRECRANENYDVGYIIGGQDRCVARDSACLDEGTTPMVLINADHRNIVVPSDHSDGRYSVVAKFLMAQQRRRAAALRPADPLFEQYKPEHEPFYIQRPFDQALASAISAGHIWICGQSGVGKTAALRRAVHRNGWLLSAITLSAYEDCSPLGMICALADELSLLATNTPAKLVERTLEAACRNIRASLTALCEHDTRAIVVEEIPLGANALPEFLDLLSRLMQIVGGQEQLADRLVFAFSSIVDLSARGTALSGKVRENVQILSDPHWTIAEIHALTGLLADALNLPLSADDLDAISMAADGRPRFVKLLFRHYRNGSAGNQPLAELIDRVRGEV